MLDSQPQADAAHVEEYNASRSSARWLLPELGSGGSSFTHCQLELEPAISTRLSRLTRAAARILVSLFRIPTAIVGGRPALLNALMGVMLGAAESPPWSEYVMKSTGRRTVPDGPLLRLLSVMSEPACSNPSRMRLEQVW